jgi:translation initiation factor IF-1
MHKSAMSEVPIRAHAIVLGPLGSLTYRVSLPNGKAIVGHLARELRDSPPEYANGHEVVVELTPYDFSKGRITGLVDS